MVFIKIIMSFVAWSEELVELASNVIATFKLVISVLCQLTMAFD